MKVIIDTCVWSGFLRHDRPANDRVVREVERLVRRDVVQMLGPIRQELLSGAQPQDRFVRLKQYLRYYPNLPLDEEDDENAAAYYNICRQRGIQATATDLLICAEAVRRDLKVYTTDTDFDLFEKHLPIKRHRIR